MQQRLQTLGNTNRARWNIFSTEPEISFDQFCQRIGALGIDSNPQEIATIWRSVGIPPDSMQFADFVRFLQASTTFDSPNGSSPKRPKTLSEMFGSNYRTVLNKFLEADPTVTGLISSRAFQEISTWFGIDSKSDIRFITQRYDDGQGSIKYFLILSDLCYGTQMSSSASFGKITPPPSLDTSFRTSFDDFYDQTYPPKQGSPQQSPQQSYQPQRRANDVMRSQQPQQQYSYSPSRRQNFEDDFKAPYIPQQPYSPYSPYNPSSPFGNDSYTSPSRTRNTPPPRTYFSPRSSGGSPGSGGRGKLDPDIFGQYQQKSPPASPSSGGRGKLDPAIFGEKPVIQGMPEQPEFNADDCTNAERVNGLAPAQLVELISKQVGKYFRGGKQCFSKWRGKDDYLTANDIRNGLAKDANILVPLRDLNIIVDQYGGPLSLSSFVRLLSDGSSYAERHSSMRGMRQTTEDESSLIRIADQVEGNEWEDVVMKARNAEEMSRGFRQIGMRVSEDDIRTLMSKLGRGGLVNAIKARLSSI